mgnify:CR=1 FL=1
MRSNSGRRRAAVMCVWVTALAISAAGCGQPVGSGVYSTAPSAMTEQSTTPPATVAASDGAAVRPTPASPSVTPSADASAPSATGEQPGPKPSAAPSGLVPYAGPVEHIFFHPLIVDPARAFDGDRMSKGYDDWFVTVYEFRRILQSLYERGYVLVDIRTLFDVREENGRTVVALKIPLVPAGKKPLVLSVDDLNYYDYMLQNGNASRLVLDDTGRVAALYRDRSGNEVISREIEIVPIVDHFVEMHPDFSVGGAKGVIALTGYEGVLGYRTQADSPQRERERSAAEPVVRRLKETGWVFASHGYGHLDARKVSLDRLKSDTERWKREVEPIVGPTAIYIYPYGSRPETGGDKFRMLTEFGFRMLCSVGPAPYLKTTDEAVMMDRRHIDGIAFRDQRERLKPLFDVEQVIDPARPR